MLLNLIRQMAVLGVLVSSVSLHSVRFIGVGVEAGKAKTTALVVAGGTAVGGLSVLAIARGGHVWEAFRKLIRPSPKPPSPPSKDIAHPKPTGATNPIIDRPVSPEFMTALEESAQKMAWKMMLTEALETEQVLLYDAAGNPIVKSSSLWNSADAECRQVVQQIVEKALDQVELSKAPSKGKLKSALGKILAAGGIGGLISQLPVEYDFDGPTGKLKVSFKTKRGEITVGEVNIYNLVEQMRPPTPPKTADTQ